MASIVQFAPIAKGASVYDNASLDLVFPGNVSTANRMCAIALHSYIPCPPTITDTQGNTWTRHVTQEVVNSYQYLSVFSAPVGSNAPNTVTIDCPCGFGNFVFVFEIAAGDATTPVDDFAGSDNVANDVVAGSVTSTVANDLIIGVLYHSGAGNTLAAGAGWTLVDEQNTGSGSVAVLSKTLGAAGAANPTGTSSAPGGVFGYSVAFKGTVGGGGGGRRRKILQQLLRSRIGR